MKEAGRAGRQAGNPLSLAQDQGELCSPFAIIPHAPIFLGILQNSGCNLGQDARSLAVNTT